MSLPGAPNSARLRGWKAAMLALAALFLPFKANALGPHEVAILVNVDSVESILLGNAYARLRAVPEANIIRVSVPKGENGAFPVAITQEDFEKRIYAPASSQIDGKGISPQILFWVYSCDFPTRVTASKEGISKAQPTDLSICGATFLRAKWPDTDSVQRGQIESPLFLAPRDVGDAAELGQSFDQMRNLLLSAMPLPSAMLTWTGERGSTLAKAEESLRRATSSDFSFPSGDVWISVNSDVRSTCREWEFADAAAAIRAFDGVGAVVSSNQPAGSRKIIGYMTGARSVKPTWDVAPGAFADHLTSFACAFDVSTQMKATKWLESGAAASSGTVTEPFAIWEKFPTAWIFVFQLQGLTNAEAFYESTFCPLQQLFLGDPLCRPWAPEVAPSITGPDTAKISGIVQFSADIDDLPAGVQPKWQWLVDGVAAGSAKSLMLDTTTLTEGPHSIRLVARVQFKHGEVQHQGFAEVAHFVANGKKKGGKK